MPSPFPGMDPYVEGYLWPDFHHELASAIRLQLVRALSERYSVQIETSVVAVDSPEEEITIMFPDVLVHAADDPGAAFSVASGVATLAPPVTLAIPAPLTMRIPTVQVRRAADRKLVTSIEIISPVNKRGAAREQFRRKWRTLHDRGVNLVDLDLVRRGQRVFPFPQIADAAYLVTVTRAGEAQIGAWPFGIRDAPPAVPIPLLAPDADATIELKAAFDYVYEVGRYHLSIDYNTSPPPPALSREDAEWARARIATQNDGG